MKSEKEFVYETAAKIYASMFANPDVREDMRYAIERAIALYDELRKISLHDTPDTEDSNETE
ncbi:MAG: hypothetical protein GJ680_16360 [Alteromonadaceae bacterium]|nr:hypothetical protein [Alteromonadaceae bacterium]